MKNRIRELRKKMKMSQEALGKLANTTKGTIAKLENGDMGLTIVWMERLAKGLKCRPSDFINDSSVAIKETALPEPVIAILDTLKAVFALFVDKRLATEEELFAILEDQRESYESLGQKGSLEVVQLLQESVVGKAILTDVQRIQQTLRRARGQSDVS